MTGFTHLHVASGYSLQYGASSPTALVERAADLDLEALALTDRDGLYGAVKFVTACSQAGVAPLLGVDLAVDPSGLLAGLPAWADPSVAAARSLARGTPARGGAVVDLRLPRVTVLAHGGGSTSRTEDSVAPGWSGLCRLVSATHLRGERGVPVATPELVARYADGTGGADEGALTVLLGPGSELGRALLARRTDLARAVLARWYDLMPLGSLAVEVVCHDGPENTSGSLGHAARMLGFAREAGVPAVLTAAVRYATPDGAATADVLDAARRLVRLDTRHLDRTTTSGYLAGAGEMADTARRVATAAGLGVREATDLLRSTEEVARRCRLDPGADLGIGQVHLPEPSLVTRGEATTHAEADAVLRRRCEAGIGRRYPGASSAHLQEVADRLDDELATIATLGYPTYFLTVAEVCDLIRDGGVRVAARGSGAGSLVNHLLGISGIDPLAHGLLMERFCTPQRAELPDIDIDVESDRRTDIYEWILERFGGDRVSCVSMMDTYRIRHAVRDVGAALGLPPSEIDVIATSFPHIAARDARSALAELPELARSGLTASRFDLLFDLVERLDALPRHIALHPCGVLLSNATLPHRSPVEASWLGFPMSQFDKDDVEVLGLLKLDVLGIRMQSAMAYAVKEIVRVDGSDAVRAGRHDEEAPYLDADTGRIDLDAVPFDDEDTYRLIRSTRTLGCFQIESPGQRELVGKFAPQEFADLAIDISLFRPGPVKSDMITPFLRARHGWNAPEYLHPSLVPVLAETSGVVVYHEQLIKIVDVVTKIGLAESDEVRRRMGTKDGQREVEPWFREAAAANGYEPRDIEQIWKVLAAFASFGFCKAHAAAFALPTYQSAWLKAHHPAAFMAGVLTHDPGMYPKRLILDDARNLGIAVLGLDVNASTAVYRVEKMAPWDEPPPAVLEQVHAGPGNPDSGPRQVVPADPVRLEVSLPATHLRLDAAVPDGRAYGIRLSLADVKGISEAEVERIVAGQPYHSLADFWHRARPNRPTAERLVVAGGFDSLYGMGSSVPVRRRGRVTRRDLLLQVADLDRWSRATASAARKAGVAGARARSRVAVATQVAPSGAARPGPDDVRAAAARQSQAAAPVQPAAEQTVQLALDLGDAPEEAVSSGLPEMSGTERVRAELDVLGLDASRHVVEFYVPLLRALGVVPSRALRQQRSRAELLVAGVKVATQTPPVRSGRRVVFLTVDDSTGPVDATFFEDAQGPYAATVFGSWLLLVRGELRRTGPRGVSLRATGAWELPLLWDLWCESGLDAVLAEIAAGEHPGQRAGGRPVGAPARTQGTGRDDGSLRGPVAAQGPEAERAAAAARRQAVAASAGRVPGDPPVLDPSDEPREPSEQRDPQVLEPHPQQQEEQRQGRRVLVHASGFRQSPYADVRPQGDDVRSTRGMAATSEEDAEERRRRRQAPRHLWHASQGSSGR